MQSEILSRLIMISGIGHLVLSMGSLLVPVALKWKQHLKVVQPLMRQMFWTYAAYIFLINICFGLMCLVANRDLVNDSFLANFIHLMIALYWLIRIGIQFFYFDRTYLPKGKIYILGEVALVILFVAFTLVHLIAFVE